MAFTGKSGLTLPDPFCHRHERGANLSGELTFVSPAIIALIGSPRPRLGGSVNTAGYTDDVHADLAWRADLRLDPSARRSSEVRGTTALSATPTRVGASSAPASCSTSGWRPGGACAGTRAFPSCGSTFRTPASRSRIRGSID